MNRRHVDSSIYHIAKLLFGQAKSSEVLNNVRQQGQSLVDDWGCFKKFVSPIFKTCLAIFYNIKNSPDAIFKPQVKTYEKHCRRLSRYGMKYTRALANICNAGITINQMDQACLETCLVKT